MTRLFRMRHDLLVLALAVVMGGLTLSLAASEARALDFGSRNSTGGSAELPPEDDVSGTRCEGTACCCASPMGSCGGNVGLGETTSGATGGSCGCSEPAGSAGDPVDVYTGRYYRTDTDLVVEGVMPIRMARRYDSGATYDSPLGYGWSFSYDMRLYEYPDGSVIVRSHCGERTRFIYTGSAYQSAEPEGGRVPTLELDGTGHVLLYPTGDQAFFDAEGRLTALQDPQGNRLEMTYSPTKQPVVGTSPYGIDPGRPLIVAQAYQLERIEEVTAAGWSTNRAVEIEYHPQTGRVTRIFTPHELPPREVLYAHEPYSGDPGNPALTTGNLTQVTGLGGIAQTFGYNDSFDSHNLTSFQEGQDMTTWHNKYFSDRDRVMKQTFGTEFDPLRSEWTFEYFDTEDPERRVVTRRIVDDTGGNPRDAITEFKFDPEGFLLEKTDAEMNRFVYVREQDPMRPPYLDKIQVYDSADTLQREIDYTFDAAGNRTQRIVTLGTSEVVYEEWEYDPAAALQGVAWVSAEQTYSTFYPTVFRTEYTFHRDGTGLPTNIHQVRRRKDDGVTFETTTFTYDVNGQLETVTPPAVVPADDLKIIRRYYGELDANPGQLREIEFEVGGLPDPHLKQTFTYDSRGFVDVVTDARGKTRVFGWDDRGRLIQETNHLGEQDHYTYTGPNDGVPSPPPGLFLTTLETGRTTALGEGQVRRLNYNARGRLVEIERKDDAAAYQSFETYAYDSDGNPLRVTDAESRSMLHSYDLLQRMDSTTDASTNVTSFGYDEVGNRIRTTDALLRDTIFEYDDLDRLVEVREEGVTPALVRTYTYDAAGNVTKVTDPKLQETDYTYDTRSRLLSVEQPLGQTVEYRYDGRGRLSRVINARDHVLDHDYLPWGELGAVRHFDNETDADSQQNLRRTVSYTYDVAGNRRSQKDSDLLSSTPKGADPLLEPAGRLYTWTYDDLNRVDVMTANYVPGGASLDNEYDRFGNRSAMNLVDNLPQTSTQNLGVLLYDGGAGDLRAGALAFDSLTPEVDSVVFKIALKGDSVAGSFGAQRPDYWGLADVQVPVLGGSRDNLPPGQDVAVDFLIEPTSGLSLAYWDDSTSQFGPLPPGETLSISLLATQEFLDGTNEVLGFDLGTTSTTTGSVYAPVNYYFGAGTTPGVYLAYAQSHVQGLSGPSNPFWIVFGTLDDCLPGSCTPTQEAFNASIEAQLDAAVDHIYATRLPDLPPPGTPLTHTWLYDDLDRLTQATLPESAGPLGFTYYGNDELEILTHGNGASTSHTYHPAGPVDRMTVSNAGSTQLHDLDYVPDAVLNVDTITERWTSGSGPWLFDYGYDGADRLTSAAYPSLLGLPGSESFPYDAAGNRDDNPANPSPWNYDANNRILGSPGPLTYTHDDDGNAETRSDGGTFTYDRTNRLRNFTKGGTTAKYHYDGFGRRIRKEVNGAWTFYLWDGDRLLAEYDGGGARQARYAYAGGLAPAQYATPDGVGDEDVYDVHSDHLGTPRLLTDGSGNPVWRAVHEAFGSTHLDPANSVTFNVRFPGQYFDTETGLHYNRFRYYEPSIGRYISADPIGQAGGLSLYAYAGNSPVNWSDPLGLRWSAQKCASVARKIANIEKRIGRRIGQLKDNFPEVLPESCPGDDLKPSLSRRGHRRLINEDKALLAFHKGQYIANCTGGPGGNNGPPPLTAEEISLLQQVAIGTAIVGGAALSLIGAFLGVGT